MRDVHGNDVDQAGGRPDSGHTERRSLLKVTAIARLLGIPMTFSLVPVEGKPGELISELRSYSNAHNTSQRLFAPSFTDRAMVANLANNRRNILIICGFATEVAVLESALGAINAGYTVHIPVDVMGSASSRTESAVLRQMELAGAVPTSIISLAAKWSPNFSEEPGDSVLAAFSEIQTTNQETSIKYRTLGNTGMVVSTLGMGTMYFGDQTTEKDAFAILDAYVEAGGNLIDTANVYAGGAAEQVVGRWFAKRSEEVTGHD